MKKIKFLLICVIIWIGLTSCNANDNEEIEYIEINSVEELYSMEADKSYKLMCNIDLQNEYWVPLIVDNFDGNGYSISNCIISDYYQYVEPETSSKTAPEYRYQAFFAIANTIENLSMSGITVVANNATNVAVVVAASDAGQGSNDTDVKLSKIYINNCSIISTYTDIEGDNLTNYTLNCGYVLGGMYFQGTVDNCEVSDSKITINTNKLNVDAGGIVGCGEIYGDFKVSNCISDNNLISVKSSGKYKKINIGGIIGSGMTDISDCVVKNSKMSIDSYSEYQSRIGGIIGYIKEKKNTSITGCASVSNNMLAKTQYGYNVGGIAGECEVLVENCYSSLNNLRGSTEKNDGSIGSYMGGLVGTSSTNIRKCISSNNLISGTQLSADKKITAGCAASCEGAIINCFAMNNTISGGKTDVFCNPSNVFKSLVYSTAEIQNNSNNVSVANISDWNNVYELLELDEKYWNCNPLSGITFKKTEDNGD